MDNTENTEFSADDFTSLFDSNGLLKDKLEGFNENQKKLRSLNEKAKDVQEENLKLKNEVKAWVNRKGQIKLAQSNIDNSYPSEVPPKGKEDDKTYQERYAIAKEFISGWRTCIDEFEDYQKKCDEFGKLFEETTQKNKDSINKTLSQLSKLSKLSLPGGSFHPLIYRLFKHSYHTKSRGCCNLGFFSKLNTMYQIENLFIEIGVNLNIYQDDITATEDKIKEYRELLDKTVLKLNRIRMARTPAYSNQAQQCFVCNRPYVFIKWCKFCDIEQFKKQFSNWGSGNPEFDKIIHDSQLSIKYPNGFIQWIPYEKFVNVEFVGRGAYANVYKANWVEGLGTWDYALGKRVRYPNTPVALKELKNSIHIGKEFLEEVTAYIKSSSSTVLRCYGISKNPKTNEYIMVFPYAHGGNLRNYMKKRLNWLNKLDILRHILYGLADIHIRGLVHRDLHPGNLLHYRRTISVSDLGLCRQVDDVTSSDEIFGVLPFIAPEVLNGEPYTQASDVYSIGIIMWFITSKEYPFYDRVYDKYLAREICENLRPKILDETPPDYKELMQKCWDKDPDKRPTTKDLYQKILFWLNEFNKTPLPDTIQQFITNKQNSFDEVHDSNVEYASQSVKTQTIKDPIIEKLAAKIKKGTNSDNDDKKYEDEADEWNTIHINDYQNWLCKYDI
ncbi:Tpk1p [Rhizophagus irregularis DAOM 197198w]|uniref:Tpk1p n=1 Tax=Rhizophagus irregularis (strain DAOM 197198w) TaxID=1432141 RepID=A0A015J0V2_RHIIW|nr:Tpk1p [Rhizophagus irregularis DAOM 197198w]